MLSVPNNHGIDSPPQYDHRDGLRFHDSKQKGKFNLSVDTSAKVSTPVCLCAVAHLYFYIHDT